MTPKMGLYFATLIVVAFLGFGGNLLPAAASGSSAGSDSSAATDSTPIPVAFSDPTTTCIPDQFGICTYIIGGNVFDDYNDDGVQDSNEPDISGVTVNLHDNTGALIDSTITQSPYVFAGLYPGTYTVSISATDIGCAVTSNPDGTNALSSEITVTDAGTLSANFGCSTTNALAFTGINSEELALFGSTIVLFGVAALAARRFTIA